MKYLVFVAYYIYAMALLAGTSYLVFYKGESPWWFALTVCLLNLTPKFSSKDDKFG